MMSGTNTGSGSLGPTPDSFAFKADAKFGASMGTDADTPTATAGGSKTQFSGLAATPSTPTQSITGEASKAEGSTISDVLLWVEPFRTAMVFITGALGLMVWWYVAHGDHTITFTSGLAYICLGLVAINCIFNLLMSSWSSYSKWSGSNMIKTTTSLATDGCTMIAVSYDKYLLATDPMLTVNVILVLWVLAWLGAHLSTWLIATLLYVGTFTLPAALYKYRKQIDLYSNDAKNMVREHVQVHLDKLKLSRVAYVGIGLLAYVASIYMVSWASVAVLTLLIVAYLRTLLKPTEVDAIRNVAEPYTQSVRRMSHKVTHKVDEYMVKYNLSPAPKPHYR